MKRTERQHLKENELQTIARQVREQYEARKRETTMLLTVVAVIAVAAVGYVAWRENLQSRAHALLAQAEAVRDARIAAAPAPGQPDPGGLRFGTERERAQAALTKFKAAADAYPSTDAGIFARYQQAVTSMTLGDPGGAAAAYQQVIDRNGDGFYAQMAKLGLAEAQARAGKFDQAIRGFQDLSERKDGRLPIDGILMQLGRTYLDAGKRTEAQQTFNRLVEEFPESPFTGDARRELDNLKKKSA
jgi:TolA-binding protein